MATVTGHYLSLLIQDSAITAGRASGDLDDFTLPLSVSHTVGALVTTAVIGARQAQSQAVESKPNRGKDALGVAIPGTGISNLVTPGAERFERIHVLADGASFGTPAFRDFGAILSTTPVELEVWNAYRLLSQSLAAITITGQAGLTVPDPYGLPTTYNPFQSRFYTATIALIGGPVIDNTITFDFTGISEPVVVFDGIRLVPFPFEPDWASGLVEDTEYLTDIFTAHRDHEQRIQLRKLPRKYFEYTPKTFTRQEAGLLEALLYGWMHQKFGVFAWWDAMRLTAVATATGQTLTLGGGTTNRDLIAGQQVVLWQNPFSWETKTVATIGATSITLLDALVSEWAANTTLVIPVWIGALSAEERFDRPARDAGEGRYRFLIEPRVV